MKKNKLYRTRVMCTLIVDDSSMCLPANFAVEEYLQRLLCDLRDLCKRASHKNVAVCASIHGRKGSFLFDGDVTTFEGVSPNNREVALSGTSCLAQGCVVKKCQGIGLQRGSILMSPRPPDRMRRFSAGLSPVTVAHQLQG